MYSKQFHFRSLEEEKWEEEEEEERKNSSPFFPTSAAIFLVPWRTSQALFRFFPYISMCHRQDFSIFILLNLHFPYLCAGSPHFHMLQMSTGLFSSLNKCTNPTSDHSAKPFYPLTTSANLLKCWWSQSKNQEAWVRLICNSYKHRGHLRIRAECRQPPDSPQVLEGTQLPVLPSIWLYQEIFF